jgi:hypothetical protein
MALKYHSVSKFVHGSRFLSQLKDKVFVFKMYVDLPGSDVALVKMMKVGGDMENSWIIFDYVKCLKDSTTVVCHVYDSRHCKVSTIACCNMQSEDYHLILLNNVGHCKPLQGLCAMPKLGVANMTHLHQHTKGSRNNFGLPTMWSMNFGFALMTSSVV